MKNIFLISLAAGLVILTIVVYVITQAEIPEPTDSQPSPATTQKPVTSAPPEPTPSPAPTTPPAPTPSPAPTQPVTDPNLLLIPLDDLPGYVPGTHHSDGHWTKDMGQAGLMRYWFFEENQMAASLGGKEPIAFGSVDTYTSIEGILTFRGNHYRNAPVWGTADILEEKLEIVWTHDIGAINGHGSYWPGTGWTGQPLLVRWPEETRRVMGLFPEMKEKDLVEVIYPAFDGNIYFLDLETGERTRDPIRVGFGMKGTGSVDPRGYPIFYTGQGLNDTNGHIGPFFYRMFDLIENKEIAAIPGSDPVAFRSWGAFDSSSLINWQTDTLLEPGENGLFYKVKLNSHFDPDAGTVSLNPEFDKLRYRTDATSRHGIESSPVAYRNLIYFADNDGNIVCLDVNTLEPVWLFAAGDDTDATLVLEETETGVYLYTGNEIDHRRRNASSQLRKLNALTGELIWQHDVPCVYDSSLVGGLLATPLIGQDDFSHLVIFNVSKTTSSMAGLLLALDKVSGDVIWERPLAAYSWSSPIAIQGNNGRSYGVFADSAGDLHLFDPLTGEDLDVISLGRNCESSPAAFDDMVVVGTYAQKIYGIRVR